MSRTVMPISTPESLRERLAACSEPDQATGCRLWRRSIDKHGYGRMWICSPRGRRKVLAHRVAHEVHVGPVEGLFVCHRCDNPPCINPDHLFVGTHADNMADMVRKGRASRYTGAAGSRNGRALLTEIDVLEIRKRSAAGETNGSLGQSFNISRNAVQAIVAGDRWRRAAAAVEVAKNAAAEERARIAVWVRMNVGTDGWSGSALADCIERGEHAR